MTLTVSEPVIVTRRADEFTLKPQGEWTYADYLQLPEDGRRYEIIKGVLYVSPLPSRRHQKAVVKLTRFLDAFVSENSLGAVFVAPFDVQLFEDNEDFTVQPDLVVVLNEHAERITEQSIIGAPDLVIEVASPSTASYDRQQKQESYRTAGVQEYWIVNPYGETVELFLLIDGDYVSQGVFRGARRLPSQVLSGLPIKVKEFFD
jgi:Uma2 family endonuclease